MTFLLYLSMNFYTHRPMKLPPFKIQFSPLQKRLPDTLCSLVLPHLTLTNTNLPSIQLIRLFQNFL